MVHLVTDGMVKNDDKHLGKDYSSIIIKEIQTEMKTFQQSHQQSPSQIRLSMLLNEPGTQTGLTDVFIGGSFWNGTRQRVSQELQLLIRPRKAPYYLLISHLSLSLSPLTEGYLFSSSVPSFPQNPCPRPLSPPPPLPQS